MKKICLLIIILFFTILSFGQKRNALIYLENGSVLKGKLIESDSTNTVCLKTSGNFWVFKLDEVKKITYLSELYKNSSQSDSVVSNHTVAGIMAGNSDNDLNAPFYLHSSINYSINKKLRLGFGAGVEFMEETQLPVFFNLEYKLRDSWFSPFLFFKTGYCIPLEDSRTVVYSDIVPDDYYYYSSSYIYVTEADELNAKGGLLINPGLGIVNMFSHNFGISFAIGYRFTRLHYKSDEDYRLDVDYNRFSVTFGITFN